MANAREQLSELHELLIEDVLERIRNGEATRDDKRLALDLCKNSNISAVAVSGSTVARLARQVDFSGLDQKVVSLTPRPNQRPGDASVGPSGAAG